MIHATRWALVVSSAAGFGVAIHTYATSLERVPVHYGLTGVPDRWGSRTDLLVIQLCIIGFATAVFLALPELMRRVPDSMISLPNRDYWLSPENRELAVAKFAHWADVFGAVVNFLLIALQSVLTPGDDGVVTPTHVPSLLIAGLLLFTLGSCVWLVALYKLPART